MSRTYCVDNKFQSVIDVMTDLGWERVAFDESNGAKVNANKEDVALIWTNLKNCVWADLKEGQVINHIKGAHHVSNKSFLAYHMVTSHAAHMMPAQWSAAYQVSVCVCAYRGKRDVCVHVCVRWSAAYQVSQESDMCVWVCIYISMTRICRWARE